MKRTEMIRETILTTLKEDGQSHIAPMGVHIYDDHLQLAPFKPSATLDNLLREKAAVINYTTDVRVFVGTMTGHRDWPLVAAKKIRGHRLANAQAHSEVEIIDIEDDEIRPRFQCKVVYQETHAPFLGFNRAQAAVIELAILVSRLDRLPPEKIEREIEYLKIALEKTAGENEQTAWSWLMQKLEEHRQRQASR